MKQKAQYLYIEIKKSLRILPRMLLQSLLLLMLIGGITLCAVKGMERDSFTVSADIAVVVREESRITEMALGYVENMESVSRLCRFLQTTEEEGFRLLEKGEVAALILLPEKLVEGIMNGANPTVDIYFPEYAGVEAMLFKELTESGEGLLRVAQAQIYGAGDTAAAYGLTEQLAVMETEIDSYNLAFALDRLALFDAESVSAFGQVNVIQYYLASGIVLFLLLSGMAVYPVMQREPVSFVRQLKRQGVGQGWQFCCQWFCGILCMAAAVGIASAMILLSMRWMPESLQLLLDEAAQQLEGGSIRMHLTGMRMVSAVLLLIVSATFVYLLYSLAGSRTSGIMLVFACSAVMFYLSGGFVPAVFLPEGMRKIGEYMPTAYLIRAAEGFVTGRNMILTGRCIAVLCCYTAVFGIIAYIVRCREE